MDKDSDAYKNKRSVYVNKLNNKDIKFPKKETLEYYEIKFDNQERAYWTLHFTKNISYRHKEQLEKNEVRLV